MTHHTIRFPRFVHLDVECFRGQPNIILSHLRSSLLFRPIVLSPNMELHSDRLRRSTAAHNDSERTKRRSTWPKRLSHARQQALSAILLSLNGPGTQMCIPVPLPKDTPVGGVSATCYWLNNATGIRIAGYRITTESTSHAGHAEERCSMAREDNPHSIASPLRMPNWRMEIGQYPSNGWSLLPMSKGNVGWCRTISGASDEQAHRSRTWRRRNKLHFGITRASSSNDKQGSREEESGTYGMQPGLS